MGTGTHEANQSTPGKEKVSWKRAEEGRKGGLEERGEALEVPFSVPEVSVPLPASHVLLFCSPAQVPSICRLTVGPRLGVPGLTIGPPRVCLLNRPQRQPAIWSQRVGHGPADQI